MPGAVRSPGTLCHLTDPAWPDVSELRIGLGCMRFSTEAGRDPTLAEQTIVAAVEAGITVFDTARAYGRDEREVGHNERLLAETLKHRGASTSARIITKGGMSRAGGAWVPDGRAKTLRADCEASLAALDGLPIDLFLIHAPDPRTPWSTSLRALARLLDEGLVRHVGLSNVNRHQLDAALELVPVSAVEVALSVFDDRALRGGIVDRCTALGIAVIAHSPLGGPRRARNIARHQDLAQIAAGAGATPAEIALAWILALSPVTVPIPGAQRPATVRSAARAARIQLAPDAVAALSRWTTPIRERAKPLEDADVVVIMGIPGAGKTRLAGEYVARGYIRLNRDERGGALRELADALAHQLEDGASRVVLDNTYLTRAARSYVVDVATRHGIPVRCVWLDTPLAHAQVNLVGRLLERFGALPTPDELRSLARREPGALAPTSQMRALRELEPPSSDEGFTSVEVAQLTRTAPSDREGKGVFVAASALRSDDWAQALKQGDLAAPHLVFDWRPDRDAGELAEDVARIRTVLTGVVEGAVCPHGGGPPRCWCRPPLPGLPLAFAHGHGVDPGRSILIGTSSAHKALAGALGARYVPV